MWRVLGLLYGVSAFYLPGVAPKNFAKDEPIEIYVDKLDSSETQLPFNYYYLNFCKPIGEKSAHENLGQILQGDRIERSAYNISMMDFSSCKELCVAKNTNANIEDFRWMIDNEYRVSLVMDNLPAGLRITTTRNNGERLSYYEDGFPIGFKEPGESQNNYYIYNHAHIVVKVNQRHKHEPELVDDPPDEWRIVGFLVNPMSLQLKDPCSNKTFNEFIDKTQDYDEHILKPDSQDRVPPQTIPGFKPMPLTEHITFTYSVTFEDTDTEWTSRWDNYLYNGGKESDEVHWLSIINSFAMVLFLSGMVAHILGRALKKDISIYNEQSDSDEVEESGWKQVHGDVFRPPIYAGIFSVIIGSGVQLIGMTLLTLFFASLGFLSPAHRGGLLTTMMLLFVFMGVFSGYSSARMYKYFGGEHWKTNTIATAFFLPGCCFSMFFIINLFIWAEESSGAVPFLHLLSILVLWLGISVPLVFLGSAIGQKKVVITSPCKVARIPKPLNIIPGVVRLKAICVMAGSLPFG